PNKGKSNIWTYFVKTSKGGKCKWCKKNVKSKGNTTNLYSHMMHNHPKISVSPSSTSQSTKRTLNKTIQNSEDSCNKLTDTSQSSTKRLKTVTDEANLLEKGLTQYNPNKTSPKSP
ncbi:hypothetical protein TSAR_000964, partial [Trichomalopsis sarcophagae]